MRRISSFIIAAVVALAGAGVASAGWDEGVAAFKAGDFNTAASEFSAVVEKTPDFDGGQYMLGISLHKLNRHADALEHLRKAYELKPDDVKYQLALGQGYLAAKRYADAAQMLQKINPSALPKGQQDEYHQMLAGALDKSGNSEAALASLKKLTELNPNDSDAWYRYGAAVFSVDTAAGVAALEKSVALDGKDPRKREALAKALVRQARETQGDRKKAIYDKAVTVASDLATAAPTYDNLLLLGELQLGAAKYRESVVTLKKAAAANAGPWFPHFYLAQAYTLLGDYDNADTSAQAAWARRPVRRSARWCGSRSASRARRSATTTAPRRRTSRVATRRARRGSTRTGASPARTSRSRPITSRSRRWRPSGAVSRRSCASSAGRRAAEPSTRRRGSSRVSGKSRVSRQGARLFRVLHALVPVLSATRVPEVGIGFELWFGSREGRVPLRRRGPDAGREEESGSERNRSSLTAD
jgi:Flp pilus assembly protein TadD